MRQNIFNPDFQDFISALNESEVAYILVGGYSVILHGYNRTTGDMDIWVKPSVENYTRLLSAFSRFGMSVFDMSLEKFLATAHYDVFTFGRPPVSIDILTQVNGLSFDVAFARAEWFEIEDSLSVRSLRLSDLLDAKKSAGRPKDLDDLDHLQPVE
ncbi:MAG: hypothetical protein KA165_20755 [Saprospiraceae bacterium]|nr:hypothetical protein [Saprospiraceae bacterium]